MNLSASGRMGRLQKLKKSKGLDAMILSSPSSLKCYSSYWYNFETGAFPFHVLPGALIFFSPEERQLLLAEDQAHATASIDETIRVISYSSYTYEHAPIFVNDFAENLRAILSPATSLKQIGIEALSLPAVVIQKLTDTFPAMRWIDITADLALLRAVKDEDEIELIRKAAHLADIGQQAVIDNATHGITELELFSRVRLALETAAGSRIPVMTDLVSGQRSADGGGNPETKTIGTNDIILSDFTPCSNGYWGDSCNSICVGVPANGQQKIFSLVNEALQIGLAALRPGVEACEVDRRMRNHLAAEGNFGHHGGHGVGTQYHEHPRIVPYNNMRLEPGMVIALEPAVYKENFGIRLEHLAVVRDDGAEILTQFHHRFTPTLP